MANISPEYLLPLISCRKHFLGDLEPYICLFENCPNPNELYPSVEQWLAHMKAHPVPSTQWVCSMRHTGRNERVMRSSEEFTSHMKDVHPGRFSDMQIKNFQTRAAQPSSIFTDCLFCDWSVPTNAENERALNGLKPIDEHNAENLLDLAPMSLPQMRNMKPGAEDVRSSSENVSLDSINQSSRSAMP